jgi:hypothetical protein
MRTWLKLFGLVAGLIAIMSLMLGGSVIADTQDETTFSEIDKDQLEITSAECRVLCQESDKLTDFATTKATGCAAAASSCCPK